MWDSAFITMFGKYAHHCFEFIGTLDNLYSKQMIDGFIGRELSIETGQNHFHRHDPTSTGPNILPWAEWQHYEMSGDKERLAQVFVPILALHRWIADNRTWKDGTYWAAVGPAVWTISFVSIRRNTIFHTTAIRLGLM